MRQFNQLRARLSDFPTQREDLLPLLGAFLVVLSFFVGLFAPGWLAESDLLLRLGVLLAILGFLRGEGIY